MTISTSTYPKALLLLLFSLSFGILKAQKDEQKQQTEDDLLIMEAVFTRPSLTSEKAPVALGGYLEANTYHRTEEGISDGLSFQARRLTIFMAASISERIKFLTEIEFEDGGNEVEIELAALDVAFHPLLNLRGGIVMNPIGAFNENHDGSSKP